jgi:GntR family transcriptional regulator|nr:GntR family transcriptional regulator [Candidatus Krumholzibacteria bacterium]
MIHIDPKDGVPIYRQVMDQIKLQVTTGQLVPGQQLESVANLSQRLKVNPMTISKAYGFLVEEGLVERRRGVGIFVAQLDNQQTEKNRHQVLSEALGDAAALTVQMGVPHQQALQIFKEHLVRLGRMKGDES